MPDSKNLLRNIAKRVQQGGGYFAIACRKAHPRISAQNGIRFPEQGSTGKYDPV